MHKTDEFFGDCPPPLGDPCWACPVSLSLPLRIKVLEPHPPFCATKFKARICVANKNNASQCRDT